MTVITEYVNVYRSGHHFIFNGVFVYVIKRYLYSHYTQVTELSNQKKKTTDLD